MLINSASYMAQIRSGIENPNLGQREPLENPIDNYESYRHREMIRAEAEEIILREIVGKGISVTVNEIQ